MVRRQAKAMRLDEATSADETFRILKDAATSFFSRRYRNYIEPRPPPTDYRRSTSTFSTLPAPPATTTVRR